MKATVLLLIAAGTRTAEQPRVPFFSVANQPAIETLLQLARRANAPLGIVAEDDSLCKSLVSYSGNDVPWSAAVQAVVTQVPGYAVHRTQGAPVLVVAPLSPRPVTTRFLNLVDSRFGPLTSTLQGLAAALWVHVRYLIRPYQGVAVSVLSSPDDPVFRIEAQNATVEQILNRIATASGATWVLRPLPPALEKVGGHIPFALFSATQSPSAQSELCTPVTE